MGYIAPVLAPLQAVRFLVDCLENGHRLLGVSGFHYLDSRFVQPEQGFEADRADFGSEEEFLGRVGEIVLGQTGQSVVFELAFVE
ncbi:MAG: hypothetical protein GY745_22160 [Actinomycetia bacterium]|nr:hypothetical protein [Actinomycetes bacterium]MCP4087724.1 hypothetical protein [Actinomycetes bacterium]